MQRALARVPLAWHPSIVLVLGVCVLALLVRPRAVVARCRRPLVFLVATVELISRLSTLPEYAITSFRRRAGRSPLAALTVPTSLVYRHIQAPTGRALDAIEPRSKRALRALLVLAVLAALPPAAWWVGTTTEGAVANRINLAFGTVRDWELSAGLTRADETTCAARRSDGDAVLPWLSDAGVEPAAADLDGDGRDELVAWRESDGQWFVSEHAWPTELARFGQAGDIPVPGDYDGDGRDELAVFRPTNGGWYVDGELLTRWGQSGDVPVPADYDGGAEWEIAIFRPGTGEWFVLDRAAAHFGQLGDVPVPADYAGTGHASFALLRPATAEWFVPMSSPTVLGSSGEVVPVPADYDGDGRDEFAVLDGTELVADRTTTRVPSGAPIVLHGPAADELWMVGGGC